MSDYTGQERREFHGIRDMVDHGKLTVEQARSREWQSPDYFKHLAVSSQPDPHEVAGVWKRQGMPRDWSWSRWIQRTGLNPGMDAKDWYAIWDQA